MLKISVCLNRTVFIMIYLNIGFINNISLRKVIQDSRCFEVTFSLSYIFIALNLIILYCIVLYCTV